MKVLKYLAVIALAGMIFWGCGDNKKSDSTGPGNNTHEGTINATISGDITLTFQCSTAYGLAGTGSMHIQGIVTQGADEYMIDIQVYHDPATGTYQLAFPPVDGVGTVAKNNVGNLSESGSITFTQATTSKLVGTFNFVAFRMEESGTGVVKKTVTVSNGTFDVPVIVTD